MNLLRSAKKRFHRLRSQLVDPQSLLLTEIQLKQASQRNRAQDFLSDRRQEVMDFYHLTPEALNQVLDKVKPHDHSPDDDDHDDHHHPLEIHPEFNSDKSLFDHYRQNDILNAK